MSSVNTITTDFVEMAILAVFFMVRIWLFLIIFRWYIGEKLNVE